jgi:hypothetical protein
MSPLYRVPRGERDCVRSEGNSGRARVSANRAWPALLHQLPLPFTAESSDLKYAERIKLLTGGMLLTQGSCKMFHKKLQLFQGVI